MARTTCVMVMATLCCHQQVLAQQVDSPYLARRAVFETKLTRRGHAPGKVGDPKVLEGYQPVTYVSNHRKLKAWLFVPPNTSRRTPKPAIVHFHGGFGVSHGHFHTCKPFARSGFIVLLPSMRGENSNDGDFELWLGEVDDAIAATKWLARQPFVDRKRIYAFGHSSGGVISSILSLMNDVPIRHSGSSGGLYDVNIFRGLADRVPFDQSNPLEAQMRVLPGNIRWMRRRHYAYYGSEDLGVKSGVAASKAEVQLAGSKRKGLLSIQQVPGDHYKSLEPAMKAYMSVIAQDRKAR